MIVEVVDGIDGRSFGYGFGSGVATTGLVSYIWKKFKGKKAEEDEDIDDVEDEEVSENESIPVGKAELFNEMAKLRNNVALEDQDTLMLQFASINAFMQSKVTDGARLELGKNLYQLVRTYNTLVDKVKKGLDEVGMELEIEGYLTGCEGNLIDIIEGEKIPREVKHSAVKAVEWIVSYLRQTGNKPAKTGTR